MGQAGFSNNTGNLQVKDNYAKINVARQKAGKVRSHYNNYRELAKLRHQEAILFGSTRIFTMKNNTVFGLTRVKRGNPGYLLLINLDDKSTEVDLVPEEGEKVKNVPSKVRMYIKSVGGRGGWRRSRSRRQRASQRRRLRCWPGRPSSSPSCQTLRKNSFIRRFIEEFGKMF